jgi:hypothetical protein
MSSASSRASASDVFAGGGEEGDGVKAAEEALTAVRAVDRKALGAHVGAALGEVVGQDGEDLAPVFDAEGHVDDLVDLRCGENTGFGLYAEDLHIGAGANLGEGEAAELFGLGKEAGVERKLRFVGAVFGPGLRMGREAGLVVDEEDAARDLVDAIDADAEGERTDGDLFRAFVAKDGEGAAFELDLEPLREEREEALLLDGDVGLVPWAVEAHVVMQGFVDGRAEVLIALGCGEAAKFVLR